MSKFTILTFLFFSLFLTTILAQPEIVVKGNGNEILAGATETSIANNTDFAVRDVGTTTTNTFTIYNTGSSTLNITLPLSWTNNDLTEFLVTSQPAATIAAGDSSSFTVEFDPQINGIRNANISIANNDSDEDPFTFALMGFGDNSSESTCAECFGISKNDPIVCNGRGPCIGNNICDCGPLISGAGCTFQVRWSNDKISNEGTFDYDPRLVLANHEAILDDEDYEYFFSIEVEKQDPFPGKVGSTFGLISYPAADEEHNLGTEDYEWGYRSDGNKIHNGNVTAYGDPYGAGDKVGLRFNATTGEVWFYLKKAGTSEWVLQDSQPAFTNVFPDTGEHVTFGLSVNCFGRCKYTLIEEFRDEVRVLPEPITDGEILVLGNNHTIEDDSSIPSVNNLTIFGAISPGSFTTFTYTISNSGSESLTINTPISLSGENSSEFEVVKQPSETVIAPGGSTTFDVKFAPSSLGIKNTDVVIVANDCDESIYNFAITGTGGNSSNSPIASSNTLSFLLGNVLTISTTDFGYSDANNNPLDHVEISTVTSNGDLWLDDDNSGTINGSESVLSDGATISKTDLDAGKLKYNGYTEDSFTFRVNDGSEYSATTYTMAISADLVPAGSGTAGNPYLIANPSNLYWIAQNTSSWDKHYKQTADIDLDLAFFNTGSGWTPIGNNVTQFSGTYDGNGHIIENLFIDRGSTNFVGLFGYVLEGGGAVKNLGVKNADVTSGQYSAIFVGDNHGVIENCFADGTLNGSDDIGILVGWNSAGGTIDDSYSTGTVNGGSSVGGLVGTNNDGSITNSYSAATVSGTSNVGGLVGDNRDTISDSFWDTNIEGTGVGSGTTTGATGKTTSEMRTKSTFTSAGWDFVNTWEMIGQNGEGYPKLRTIGMVTVGNVGNSNFARSTPRNIAFKAQSGRIAATFKYVDSTHSTIPDDGRSVGEFWEISSLSGNTKIRLYYDPAADDGFSGTPTIFHYTGGSWVALPTEAIGTAGSLSYVETTNYRNTFSPVTVGDGDAALPVELVSFEGCNTEEGVLLKWETATEVNNFGFEILRSAQNDSNWDNIGFVQGNGTTNSPKNYEFTDSELPNVESVDYRLKQIDNDGTFAYSKTITVDLTTITDVEDEVVYEFALEQNYPNPFNPTTTINFSLPSPLQGEGSGVRLAKLVVYDILGREVATLVNQKLQPGNHEVNFDASSLSSGIYIYRIDVGDEFNSIRKMLLIK